MKKRVRAVICKIDGILIQDSVTPVVGNFEQLKKWREQGMKLAAVSVGKNELQVLSARGLSDFFDIVRPIENQPNPEALLDIASLLDISSEEIMVIDDSSAGITAAKRGGFGLVVAVLHFNNQALLDEAKPDGLISQLKELFWTGISIRYPQHYLRVPHLRSQTENIFQEMSGLAVAVFLDYDGTLTPIAADFEKARLDEKMAQTLVLLAKKVGLIAIVSGRDTTVLKDFIKLPTAYYVGNHGFDIEGPKETGIHHEMGNDFVAVLKNFCDQAQKELAIIPGVQIEPKKFTVAVHYRHVDEKDEQTVIDLTRKMINQYPQLKMGCGKKVLEARPNVDWDKGKAVNWIINKLKLDSTGVRIFYLGDDITDEDALRTLPENGIGILVGNHSENTYAEYRLNDPQQVQIFLESLTKK